MDESRTIQGLIRHDASRSGLEHVYCLIGQSEQDRLALHHAVVAIVEKSIPQGVSAKIVSIVGDTS